MANTKSDASIILDIVSKFDHQGLIQYNRMVKKQLTATKNDDIKLLEKRNKEEIKLLKNQGLEAEKLAIKIAKLKDKLIKDIYLREQKYILDTAKLATKRADIYAAAKIKQTKNAIVLETREEQKARKERERADAKATAEKARREKAARDAAAREQKRILNEAIKAEKKALSEKARAEKKALEEKARAEKKALADREKAEIKAAKQRNTFSEGLRYGLRGGNDNSTYSAGIGQKLGTVLGYGAASLPVAAVAALGGAMRNAVNYSMELEEAFADLAAKSMLTHNEMTLVKEAIFNTASATKFSAIEVAGLSIELSKLGYKSEAVIDMLPAIAYAAAASGESLEATGRTIGNVMHIFGLTSDRAMEIADMMTKSFKSSALNIHGFSMAMSYAGAAAESTGTNFVSLTSAMAVLSDRGITASKMGTGLREIFASLAKTGKSLDEILAQVNEGHFTYADAVDLVGKRAANQLFILAQHEEAYLRMKDIVFDSVGEAAESAAKQMMAFTAQWVALKNEVGELTEGWLSKPFTNLVRDARYLFGGAEERKSLNKELILAYKEQALYLKELYDTEVSPIRIANLMESKFGDVTMYKAFNKQELNNLLDEIEADIEKEVEKRKIKSEIDNSMSKFENSYESMLTREHIDKVVKKIEDDYYSAMELKGGQITNERRKFLVNKVLGINPDLTKLEEEEIDAYFEKLFSTIELSMKKYTPETFKDNQEKKIDEILSLPEVNRLVVFDDGTFKFKENMNDMANATKHSIQAQIEELNKLAKALCEANFTDWCKEDKSKNKNKKYVIPPVIDKEQVENTYLKEKAKLEASLGIAEQQGNIILQEELRNKLVDNNKKYYEDLGTIYANYVEKMISEGDKLSSEGDSTNAQKFYNVAQSAKNTSSTFEGKSEQYETIINNKTYREYVDIAEKTAKALEEYTEVSASAADRFNKAKSAFQKIKILDEIDDINKEYYDKLDASIDAEIAQNNEFIKKLEEAKKTAEDAGLEFSDEKALVASIQRNLTLTSYKDKNKSSRDKANQETDSKRTTGSGELITSEELRYYLTEATSASQNVMDIIKDVNAQRLEATRLLVEQELELIAERYDREIAMHDAALRHGNINQEEAERARRISEKKRIDSENKENKKLFEAQQKADRQNASMDAIIALATAAANVWAVWAANPVVAATFQSISSAAILAQTGMKISAINGRKFSPQKYESGGLVQGKLHSQGGIPFTVRGEGGYEMEGGEYIINRKSTAKYKELLDEINNTSKIPTRKTHFADGGIVTSGSSSLSNSNIMERLIEALNKPVRAYVTNQDLAKSNSERLALTRKSTIN